MSRLSNQTHGNRAFEHALVLAPSYAQAQNHNVSLALNEPQGAFSCAAISFDEWIDKLWELEGDGRKPAAPLQSRAIAEAVAHSFDFEHIVKTPGSGKALCDCVRRGLGVPQFEQALQAVRAGNADDALGGEFTAAEREMLAAAVEFTDRLQAAGLIERGSMLDHLAERSDELFPSGQRVIMLGNAPLTAQQQAFFDRCPAVELDHAQVADPQPIGRASVHDVRVALPAGAYAQPQVVLDAIRDALHDGCGLRVVVSCKHPLDLFERIAIQLEQAAISCAVLDTKEFTRTDFGHAYLRAMELMQGEGALWDKAAFSDLLHSSIALAPKRQVWRADRTLRGNRLATRDDALAQLRRTAETSDAIAFSSDIVQAFMTMVQTGDPCKEVFETAFNALRARGLSEGYVREQQNAYQALVEVLDTSKALGCEHPDIVHNMLQTLRLPVNWRVGTDAALGDSPGFEPQVRIMSLERASQLPTCSVDTLIMCDLTTESYPLREPQSAASMLLERLGAGKRETALARARRVFSQVIDVPAQRLVVGRCLNDSNAEPFYPSAMLQEFCVAYSNDASEDEGRFGFPPALLEHCYEGGEEDLLCDVRPTFGLEDGDYRMISVFAPGHVGAAVQGASPHRPDQQHPELPRLSASQIENFLECPYKWLIVSRVGANSLDEELGPRESGTFLHSVFQHFYSAFGSKVTDQNFDDAYSVLFGDDGESGIFAETIQAQYQLDEQGRPLSGRYAVIPGTEEEYEWDRLRQRTLRWLEFETGFLPRFTPTAFECRVKGVEFAGAEIDGIIDRIDIDEQGRAIVVDYKGTLKYQHRAKDKEGFRGDGKVQGLVYARLLQQAGAVAFDGNGETFLPIGAYENREAVRVVPIAEVVGALYASYSGDNRVSGALDGRFVGKADVPTLTSAEHNVLGTGEGDTFDDLLDFVEQRAKIAIAALVNGEFAPHPCGSAACEYCPVLSCEKRC